MKTLSHIKRTALLLRDLSKPKDDERAHARLLRNAFPLSDMPVGSLIQSLDPRYGFVYEVSSHDPAPRKHPECGDRITICEPGTIDPWRRTQMGIPAYYVTSVLRKGPLE